MVKLAVAALSEFSEGWDSQDGLISMEAMWEMVD